ncbi:EXPH5 protein, partial [Polyodon spathula]|nr:EXPH5 protein [Polyodon spathula]
MKHNRQQGAPVSPHATENEKSSQLRLFNKFGVDTESKVDQILNCTELTFSDKWFEDESLTGRKRSKTMFDASSKSLDLNYKNANKEFQCSHSDKNRNTLVNINCNVQELDLDWPNNWSRQKNISFSESEDFQYNAYNINSSRSLKDISVNCNQFYSMDYKPRNNRSYSVNSYYNDRTSGYNRLSTGTKVTATMKQSTLSKSHYKMPLYDPEDVENKKELFKTQQSGNNRTRHKSFSFCESEGMQNSTSGNILSSKSLKVLNVNKNHFFTTDYGLKRNRSYSVNCFNSRTAGYNRLSTGPKLCKSQSELLDYNPEDVENENKASHYRMSKANLNKNFGGKKRLPEISIYDEEQQARYLDHVRKSLTVGRIWKPGCLQNPSSPNSEERLSLEKVVLLGSTSTGSRTASQDSLSPSGQMPPRSYLNSLSDFVESDSDTTTDDEYYLNVDGNDKESEL